VWRREEILFLFFSLVLSAISLFRFFSLLPFLPCVELCNEYSFSMGTCPLCDLEVMDEVALTRHVDVCFNGFSSSSSSSSTAAPHETKEQDEATFTKVCPVCDIVLPAHLMPVHIERCLGQHTKVSSSSSSVAAASFSSTSPSSPPRLSAPRSLSRDEFSTLADRLLLALDKGEARGETSVPFVVARRIIFDLHHKHKSELASQAEQFLAIRLELEATIATVRGGVLASPLELAAQPAPLPPRNRQPKGVLPWKSWEIPFLGVWGKKSGTTSGVSGRSRATL
jgi:hypothetical protein